MTQKLQSTDFLSAYHKKEKKGGQYETVGLTCNWPCSFYSSFDTDVPLSSNVFQEEWEEWRLTTQS